MPETTSEKKRALTEALEGQSASKAGSPLPRQKATMDNQNGERKDGDDVETMKKQLREAYRALEEKDRDLQLAAQIGQNLLNYNNELRSHLSQQMHSTSMTSDLTSPLDRTSASVHTPDLESTSILQTSDEVEPFSLSYVEESTLETSSFRRASPFSDAQDQGSFTPTTRNMIPIDPQRSQTFVADGQGPLLSISPRRATLPKRVMSESGDRRKSSSFFHDNGSYAEPSSTPTDNFFQGSLPSRHFKAPSRKSQQEQEHIQRLEAQNAELLSRITQLTTDLSSLTKSSRHAISKLEEDVQKYQHQSESLLQQRNTLENQASKLVKEKLALRKELTTRRKKDDEIDDSQVEEMKNKLASLNNCIQINKNRLQRTNDEKELLEVKCKALEQELSSVRGWQGALQEERITRSRSSSSVSQQAPTKRDDVTLLDDNGVQSAPPKSPEQLKKSFRNSMQFFLETQQRSSLALEELANGASNVQSSLLGTPSPRKRTSVSLHQKAAPDSPRSSSHTTSPKSPQDTLSRQLESRKRFMEILASESHHSTLAFTSPRSTNSAPALPGLAQTGNLGELTSPRSPELEKTPYELLEAFSPLEQVPAILRKAQELLDATHRSQLRRELRLKRSRVSTRRQPQKSLGNRTWSHSPLSTSKNDWDIRTHEHSYSLGAEAVGDFMVAWFRFVYMMFAALILAVLQGSKGKVGGKQDEVGRVHPSLYRTTEIRPNNARRQRLKRQSMVETKEDDEGRT